MKTKIIANTALIALTATGMAQTASSFVQPDSVRYEGIYGSPGYDGPPDDWTYENPLNLINGSGLDSDFKHEDVYGGAPYDSKTRAGNYFNSYTWMVMNAKHVHGRPDNESETAYLGFDTAVNVDTFYIWNPNSGGEDWGGLVEDFQLTLYDTNNVILYEEVLTADKGDRSPNRVDAQAFDLGGDVQGVSSMQFRPLSAHDDDYTDSGVMIGEIGFNGSPIPEPTSMLLLSACCLGFLARRKRD